MFMPFQLCFYLFAFIIHSFFSPCSDIISLTGLKQLMINLENLDNSQPLEAMMNIMQATFLVLQSSIVLNEDILTKGQKTFHTLFSLHFKNCKEVKLQ